MIQTSNEGPQMAISQEIRLCTSCLILKPPNEFTKDKRVKCGLSTRCLMCSREYSTCAKLQGGKCAICASKDTDELHSKLVVDHCHTSGEVRGLLCRQCNIGLGAFKDNIKSLQNAVDYLGDN